MLSSNSNRQIKELIKLQNQAKYRKKSGMFVAEGAKLVTSGQDILDELKYEL